jgi:hypothetical protein
VHACLDDLVIALYVTIDELLGPRLGPGRRPKLSDAELICLAVAQVLLGARSERHWLRFARDRLGHLFPYLPGQAGYNKRLRAAAHQLSLAIRHLAMATRSWCDGFRLLDATALPCGQSRQTVKRSARWPHAAYGYDRSHRRWYWASSCTCSPLQTPCRSAGAWPPKLGEREVAAVLLDDAARQQALAAATIILADKGFAGRALNRIWQRWAPASSGRIARMSRAGSDRLAACASGSRAWSTPSRTSWGWNNMVVAPWVGGSSASASGCWPWPPASGATGSSGSPTSGPCPPTTTEPLSTQSESII